MSNTITVCDPLVQQQHAHHRQRPWQRSVLTCLQGEIYEKIIQEVINASQNDFEENGVQQQTLMELQQVGHVSFLSALYLPLCLCFRPLTVYCFLCCRFCWHISVRFSLDWLLPAKLKRRRRKSGGSGA
jgi:hypothetical protein